MVCDQRATNIWVARIIPVILLGAFTYASWVVTKHLCIDYLIHPPLKAGVSPRPGLAAAILVIFYGLLIANLLCYARLLQTVLTNPGFLPYGRQWYESHDTNRASNTNGFAHHGHHDALSPEKNSRRNTARGVDLEKGLTDLAKVEFWQRDIFICNYDGRPPWCNTCMTFKTDRTHHCRETNRCVQKMDHFCPWVGGIVSETSLKFFIQFVAYTALFTTFTLICMACFVAEKRKKTGHVDAAMVIAVALAALFFLFSFGMTMSTTQMAMLNVSTVENLTRKTKIWYLAIHIPPGAPAPPQGQTPKFMTITYPRPPEEESMLQQSTGQQQAAADVSSTASSDSPPRGRSHYIEPRTFAILQTKKGENPFNVGHLENLKQVMGNSFLDWVVPLKHSPCTDHSSPVSAYKMNKRLVKRLQREAHLLPRKDRA